MNHRIIPAIMSGGAGTRLWPLSTEAKPKQFHALGGDETLFASTARRVHGDVAGLSFAPPIVICNAAHADMVRQELGAPASAIVLEPAPRNTSAVAAIAAALSSALNPDALVLLLPADHLVADVPAFHAAIARAAPFARDRIVTFGITPDRPATGYGYIKSGAPLGDGVFVIDAFREKPNEETARGYLAATGCFWNAGIFLFHPATLLAEFAASADIRDGALASLAAARRQSDAIYLDATAFSAVRSAPLDIAVMETTSRAAVVPCDIGWADIGSWDEIYRASARDDDGNVRQGAVITLDAQNNMLRGDGVTVCVAGISDLVVVATADTVIVLPRARAQDVKQLLALANKPK